MKEKILVALSDITLANALSQKIIAEGGRTIIAKDGDDALARLRTEAPDAALIDFVLPGKSGYDVLAEKSLDRMITKIPVIVVSNSGNPVDMRRLPATASIRDYTIKAHVDPQEVLEKLSAVFGRAYVISHVDQSPAQAASQAASQEATKNSGKKILWVEDDRFLGSILFKKFETSGYTVLKATNGDEAFVLLEKETPDIIVLDIFLSGMNGLDILQKIKMDPKLRPIPVLMLSNTSKSSDIETAKTLGAQKFLVKAAVSLDEIIKEVKMLIK